MFWNMPMKTTIPLSALQRPVHIDGTVAILPAWRDQAECRVDHRDSVAQIQEALANTSLVVVQGPLGAGKTLLGHILADALPDAVLLCLFEAWLANDPPDLDHLLSGSSLYIVDEVGYCDETLLSIAVCEVLSRGEQVILLVTEADTLDAALSRQARVFQLPVAGSLA